MTPRDVWTSASIGDGASSRPGGVGTLTAAGEAVYPYALQVPADFVAENTGLMILHAMEKLRAFAEMIPMRPSLTRIGIGRS